MGDEWIKKCVEAASTSHPVPSGVTTASSEMLDGLGGTRKLTPTELAPFVTKIIHALDEPLSDAGAAGPEQEGHE
mgnify:CR=1 FL=1